MLYTFKRFILDVNMWLGKLEVHPVRSVYNLTIAAEVTYKNITSVIRFIVIDFNIIYFEVGLYSRFQAYAGVWMILVFGFVPGV